MKRRMYVMTTLTVLFFGLLDVGGCAGRRAKKDTVPDVLTPSFSKTPAPIGLIVLSPEMPGFFPNGKVAMLRAPDNWEANLELPASPEEPYVFMVSYATAKTVVVGLGTVSKVGSGIDLQTQAVMDHISITASGEFVFVDQIEVYKSGYKIRVQAMVKRPSGDELIKTNGVIYIMPFPGKPDLIFRALVFGASEEGYEYIAPFEKALESLSLVDLEF